MWYRAAIRTLLWGFTTPVQNYKNRKRELHHLKPNEILAVKGERFHYSIFGHLPPAIARSPGSLDHPRTTRFQEPQDSQIPGSPDQITGIPKSTPCSTPFTDYFDVLSQRFFSTPHLGETEVNEILVFLPLSGLSAAEQVE